MNKHKLRKLLRVLRMQPPKIGGYVFFCQFHGKTVDLRKVNKCYARKCSWLSKIPRSCYYRRFATDTSELSTRGCPSIILEVKKQ